MVYVSMRLILGYRSELTISGQIQDRLFSIGFLGLYRVLRAFVSALFLYGYKINDHSDRYQ